MDADDLARFAVRAELEALETELIELAGHLNAGEHRFLTRLAEFDRREGWVDWGGTHSCAHWLQWKLGLSLGTAREKVRVARALEQLPQISAAMAQGRLSYCKVRALTRVAEPATESYLLDVALRATGHHVEKLVRGYRRAMEAEELSREAQQQATRSVHVHHDDDGSLVIRARLPAEAGELLLKALDTAVESQYRESVSAETSERSESLSQRRADALAILAESFLAHGSVALQGGERQQIVVHVDAETLAHTHAGRCELEDGPGVSAETCRRLACDASLVTIVEDGDGQPLNVGRKTRTIPPAIRRALRSRDRGCRFPGCTHTRFVDGHHVEHWAHGGETKLSNLVTLCRFHHRLVHEGGVRIEWDAEHTFRFIRADGTAIEDVPAGTSPPTTDWTRLPALNREHELEIDSGTAGTGWRGEPMDYGWAVQALQQRSQRARQG
jgi:hypothetical protein